MDNRFLTKTVVHRPQHDRFEIQNVCAGTTEPGDLNFDRLVRHIWGGPDEIIDFVYVPQDPAPENNFAAIMAIINDRAGNVKEYLYDASNRLVISRDYTGRADADQPTTETENRPTDPLRDDDPPSFETRYEHNIDALPTLIAYPNGNSEHNIYERDLNPMAPPRARGNLREVHKLPGPLSGDQGEIVELFEYADGLGGCCGANFVIRHVDGRGNETLHQYDANGNRLHTQHRIPSVVEDWEYNAFGQVTLHILPDNGAGSRRQDAFTYYGPEWGCMYGYLKERIIDAPGFELTTTYEYDCLGRITRTIDPRGYDGLYTYNQLDQPVREQSREVDTPNGPTRYERLIWYDANDNMVRIDVQNIDDQGALQPNEHFTTVYEYDILNYVTRVCQEVGDFAGDVPGPADLPSCDGLPDQDFVATEYDYDANRNQTLVRFGEGANGNQPTNVVRTLYDERDLVFQIIRGEGDQAQSTSQVDYDGNGNRKAQRDGLENSPRLTTSTWDGYDRLVSTIDPMGNVATIHYDANGNSVSHRTDGELIDVDGNAGNIRLSEVADTYDAMDRLIVTERAFFDTASQDEVGDGIATTQITYSDNSQVLQVVDDNGHASLTLYDSANRPALTTDAKANTVSYTYDANSNVIQMTAVDKSDLGQPDEQFVTDYVYDNLDRLVRLIDNQDDIIDYAYDSRDNQTLVMDALRPDNESDPGNVVRHIYDGLNRRLQTQRFVTDDGTGAGDLVDTVTHAYIWDDSSRLIGQTDDNGHTTTYVYDALNRRMAVQMADCTQRNAAFDVHDNIVAMTDANGTAVTGSHDLLDRLIARAVTPGGGVSDDTTFELYAYDGLSRLVQAEDDDSLVARGYDSLSHVTTETLNGQTTLCSYDGVGNQMDCTYPGGRAITRTFDALDRHATISDESGLVASYEYIGPARVELRSTGNNTQLDYAYDGVQRITGTTHTFDPGGSAATIDARTYAWDRMSNKTQRIDVREAGPRLTHTYTYDSVYRLTDTSVSDANTNVLRDTDYTLDGVGNRLQVNGAPDPGVYTLDGTLCEPGDLQVNQYTTAPFDTARAYDKEGNLTAFGDCLRGDANTNGTVDESDVAAFADALLSAAPAHCTTDTNDDGTLDGDDLQPLLDILLGGASPAGPVSMAYDYRNRMVEYHDSATGRRHTYAYDALGRRIARIVDVDGDVEETRYFYDGWRIIEEQNGAGATLATYVYGRYIDEPLTMRRDVDGDETPEDYFYHADDQFNVTALTNASGVVVERYDYEDYGRPGIAAHVQSPDKNTAYISDSDGSQLIADEFSFSRPVRIGGVRWWGAYGFGSPPATDDFTIRIHADDGGTPGAVLFEAAIGNDRWRSATGRILNVGPAEFIYEADLPEPFEAEAGAVYWLVIVNDTTGQQADWGIESAQNGGDSLMYSQDDGGTWEFHADDCAFELFTDESPLGNPYLFTGRQYDPETGLYHYRTRYLDPRAGRFTTRDGSGTWGDETNLGNGYTYVGNNPWSAVDPTGQLTTQTISGTMSRALQWNMTYNVSFSCRCDAQGRPTCTSPVVNSYNVVGRLDSVGASFLIVGITQSQWVEAHSETTAISANCLRIKVTIVWKGRVSAGLNPGIGPISFDFGLSWGGETTIASTTKTYRFCCKRRAGSGGGGGGGSGGGGGPTQPTGPRGGSAPTGPGGPAGPTGPTRPTSPGGGTAGPTGPEPPGKPTQPTGPGSVGGIPAPEELEKYKREFKAKYGRYWGNP